MTTPHVSIVVLSWNTKDLLANCLNALARDPDHRRWEVLVVDNASGDGSADLVAEQFPWVKLIRNTANLLYSEGNNIGARAACGTYLCLLNSDTEVFPGAITMLADYLSTHSDCGAVSPQLLWPDGRIQHECKRLLRLRDVFASMPGIRRLPWSRKVRQHATMDDFDHTTSRDVDQPPGACMMMRREEYLTLGGLDPRLSLFFNDVDLCQRLLRNQRRIYYLAEAKVYHHHGASTKKKVEEFGHPLWQRNRIAYFRKYGGALAALLVTICFLLESIYIGFRILLGRRPWSQKLRALSGLGRYSARCVGLARI